MPKSSTATFIPIYRALPGHMPRSRNDRSKRVQCYVQKLLRAADEELRRILGENVSRISQQALSSALKEIVVLWIYLEAVDQGGETMPQWLNNYFKLSLATCDMVVASPPFANILQNFAECTTTEQLSTAAGVTMGKTLAPNDHSLLPGLAGLLKNSRALRQAILKYSLTHDLLDL